MTKEDQGQDLIETGPLNDLPLTAEQADKATAGGEGRRAEIHFVEVNG